MKLKEFLLTWHKEIVFILLFFVELLLSFVAILKKRKKETPIILDLLELVPKYIQAAEKILGAGKGSLKRDFVLDRLSEIFYKYTGRSIDESTFKFLSKAIEDILATPQKKENS